MVDFNVQIGMKFSEIETVIKQYGKENEAAAKSIFNMIKDEKECGADMEISNLNELRMVTDWLKSLFPGDGNKPNKDVDVQMPDALAKKQSEAAAEGNLIGGKTDDGQTLTYRNSGNSAYHEVEYKLDDGRIVVDTLYDNNGDGVADQRSVNVYVMNETGFGSKEFYNYDDYDLDGEFDYRFSSGVSGNGIDEFRNNKGKWVDEFHQSLIDE